MLAAFGDADTGRAFLLGMDEQTWDFLGFD